MAHAREVVSAPRAQCAGEPEFGCMTVNIPAKATPTMACR